MQSTVQGYLRAFKLNQIVQKLNTIQLLIYVLVCSPVDRTGSPQCFSLNQILQKLNTIQLFIYLFIEGL